MSALGTVNDAVFFSSLSKGLRDETHLSDECKAVPSMGQLNEHGRIVYLFVRLCKCGKYENRYDLLLRPRIVNLPIDGVDVHGRTDCSYHAKPQAVTDYNGTAHRQYKLVLDCHCGKPARSTRRAEYN